MKGNDFPAEVRRQILERDRSRCIRCGRYITAGSIHHRKLRSQGGQGTAENGITLCGSGTTGCHGWVHAHPSEAYELGFMVHSWDDPARVPIKGVAGIVLLVGGTYEPALL